MQPSATRQRVRGRTDERFVSAIGQSAAGGVGQPEPEGPGKRPGWAAGSWPVRWGAGVSRSPFHAMTVGAVLAGIFGSPSGCSAVLKSEMQTELRVSRCLVARVRSLKEPLWGAKPPPTDQETRRP